MDQLQSDLEGLVSELNDLSQRNDELMNAKDSDLAVIQNLDAQLKDYKRKYESAKTELRSLKGLGVFFLVLCIGLTGVVVYSYLSTLLASPEDGFRSTPCFRRWRYLGYPSHGVLIFRRQPFDCRTFAVAKAGA